MGILIAIERRLFGAARDRLSRWYHDHRFARPDRGFAQRSFARSAPSPMPGPQDSTSAPKSEAPDRADERTIRRIGEAELGGVSSEASRAAYESGQNPGGLHHGGKGPAPRHGNED